MIKGHEIDPSKVITNPEDKIDIRDNDRMGKNKQFIKSYYIKSKATDDGMDKVLLITKDEYENKYLDIIEEPHLQFYVTKPEYWEGQNVNYIEKEKVDRMSCIFKDRYWAIPEMLGDMELTNEVHRLLGSGYYEDFKTARDLVDMDGRLHGSDINIEDQYINLLLQKYPDDDNNNDYIRKGFYDIEVDGTEIDGFPEPEEAEAPINMITYVDSYTHDVYVYILKYESETYKEALSKKDEIIEEIYQENIEIGFEFNIDIIECETEIELIGRFLENVNQKTTPDFLLAWNADFDFATIFNRIKKLGQDPAEFFSPKEFPYKDAWYRLDTGATDPANKSSSFMTTSYTNWLDQLALYASINKGAKTLESYTLESVAQEELGAGKADYDGEIIDLFQRDYTKFLQYGIQDSILLYRIENKIQHVELLYYMSIMTATRPTHVLKKTISLRNLGNIFYYDNGYIISNNRAKQFPRQAGKIAGGYVGDPNLVDNVGVDLSTGMSQFLHDDVTDVDLKSLYPSITEAYNISPETHMGKIDYLNDKGEDETIHFMDGYTSDDPINFGIEFLGLPNVEELASILEDGDS